MLEFKEILPEKFKRFLECMKKSAFLTILGRYTLKD